MQIKPQANEKAYKQDKVIVFLFVYIIKIFEYESRWRCFFDLLFGLTMAL